MSTILSVGQTVRARFRIAEELFGREVVHAEAGDFGTVVNLAPGCLPTISFRPSGTTYDCAPDEVEPVKPGMDVNPVAPDEEVTVRIKYVTCRECDGVGRATTDGDRRITCPTCRGFLQELVRI